MELDELKRTWKAQKSSSDMTYSKSTLLWKGVYLAIVILLLGEIGS